MRQGKRSVADLLRAAARRWVDSAALADLVQTLPESVFGLRVTQPPKDASPREVMAPATVVAPEKRSGRRRLVHLKPEQCEMIRQRLKGLKVGTPAYTLERDKLCRELGARPRQVTGAVLGKIAAAAKAKKK